MEIFVKDFSRTTCPRILKFLVQSLEMTSCTVYQRLARYGLSVPLFVHFSFSLTKFSVTDFSASI